MNFSGLSLCNHSGVCLIVCISVCVLIYLKFEITNQLWQIIHPPQTICDSLHKSVHRAGPGAHHLVKIVFSSFKKQIETAAMAKMFDYILHNDFVYD